METPRLSLKLSKGNFVLHSDHDAHRPIVLGIFCIAPAQPPVFCWDTVQGLKTIMSLHAGRQVLAQYERPGGTQQDCRRKIDLQFSSRTCLSRPILQQGGLRLFETAMGVPDHTVWRLSLIEESRLTFPSETSSTSVMMPWFQNASYDPFAPREQRCELGNYPVYSIDVSSADDIAAGFKTSAFRELIFSSFLGKSAGKGALSLWTSNMKSTVVIKKYKSSSYNETAMEMAAGVRGADVYPVVKANGLVVVGGSCPSVGLVGGFTQGGGHSIFTSSFSMGADQVLGWEVITDDGRRVTAAPKENSDLYWALSGGSPGAFGVVVSTTIRAYKDRRFGGAALSFTSAGITIYTFWKDFSSWQAQVRAVVDSGASAAYVLSANLFLIQPLAYPGATEAQTRNLLKPFTDTLNRLKQILSRVSDFLTISANDEGARLWPGPLVVRAFYKKNLNTEAPELPSHTTTPRTKQKDNGQELSPTRGSNPQP
ncbi:hypothetical protein BKA80DRAFT_300164 [Phyllosticta citrichinensis]